MTLLIHRDRTPPVSRPTLANIPVAVWLIWGDELVPLRQARRALQTWAGRHERTGWTQAQATAQAVLKQMDHPDADPSDRTRLVDAVAQAAYTGTVDTQQLDALVRRVFDPNQTGLTRGPMGIMKAGDYANITGARTTALAALQTAPDAAYTAARAQYQHVGSTPPAQLLKLNQRTISAAALGATTRPFDQVVNNACLDLITILGYVLKRQEHD